MAGKRDVEVEAVAQGKTSITPPDSSDTTMGIPVVMLSNGDSAELQSLVAAFNNNLNTPPLSVQVCFCLRSLIDVGTNADGDKYFLFLFSN
jgi:hypothetical protein